ncbi:hypothetical protein ACQPZG_01050 (plasmid) [Streptomyces sp. CA-294286]|uniref:hypothetical protein n=1 Tax=Streptomyces sp. CA-294286 TaxID=3240070 RepID=UPI003D933FFD
MRSLKIATGTALAGTALLLTAPLTAHAAQTAPSGCETAQSQALAAEDDYEAAKKQYEAGDKSLKQQVDEAEQNANMLASEAQRICGDTVMNPTRPAEKHPRGAMHTGVGTTSDNSGTEVAIGVGVAGALAAGVLLMARRRNHGQG